MCSCQPPASSGGRTSKIQGTKDIYGFGKVYSELILNSIGSAMDAYFLPLPLSARDQRLYCLEHSSIESIIKKCKKYGVPLDSIHKLNRFYRTVIIYEKVRKTPKLEWNKLQVWRKSIGPHLDRYLMPKNIQKNSPLWHAVKYRRWKLRRRGLHPLLGEEEFIKKHEKNLNS